MQRSWIVNVAPAFLLACIAASAARGEEQPALALPIPAEAKASEKKVDPQQVQKLIERLASESYEEREQATADLIKLGPASLPELEKWEKQAGDPEVLQRLSLVRVELGLGAVTTLEQAKALYLKYIAEALQADLGSEQAEKFLARAARAMKLVEQFAPENQRSMVAASLCYESGMRHYRQYQAGNKAKIVLLQASKEFEAAVDHYQKHLDKHAADKAAEERMQEANMLLYACRKYASF